MSGSEKLPLPPVASTTDTSSAAAQVANANNDSAAAAIAAVRRSPTRTIRENVHTNVLGRDAGDSITSTTTSSRGIGFGTADNSSGSGNGETTMNAAASGQDINSAGLWGMATGLFGGSNENNSNSNTNNRNKKRRNGKARYDGLQQSLAVENGTATHYDPPPLSMTTAGSASSVATDSMATTTTREDRVRQDCSYFYQGMDDDPSSLSHHSPLHTTRSHRGTGRTAAAANSLLRRMSVRARLSGEVDGALFMSRYERLNQVVPRASRRSRSKANALRHQRGQQYTGNDNSSSNDIHHLQENNHNIIHEDDAHDLFLDEDHGPDDQQQSTSSYREHIPSPTNNVVMGATSLVNPHGVRSSIFFEQDGKMLMRLPRDQVRLVMDYNLEPGILSVEQWRSQEDADKNSEKLAMQNSRTKLSVQREKHREKQRKQKQHRAKQRQRQKEKEQRRRRRRRREQRELEKKKNSKNGNTNEQTTSAEAPLEVVPLEDEKGQPRDMKDPNKDIEAAADINDDDSYSSYSDDDDDDDSYFDDDDFDDDFDDDDDSDNDNYPLEDLLPELKYVITIPDDLYRRMVGEMSAKAFPPYWGFFGCCNLESGRADIKLAIVIMTFVMLLLFVGSLEWRTT